MIRGEDYHHLANVKRVRVNDIILLRDATGRRITSRILTVTGSCIEAEEIEAGPETFEPVSVCLCAAVLKGKNFDLVVQKCTEAGVSRIIPFISERVVADPGDKGNRKAERWRKIALEASKQSMRPAVPQVDEVVSFSELIKVKTSGLKIIAHPGAGLDMKDYLRKEIERGAADRPAASLMVGPEGGFSERELSDAASEGWAGINFGFSQLRAETASIILSSIIIYELGGKR